MSDDQNSDLTLEKLRKLEREKAEMKNLSKQAAHEYIQELEKDPEQLVVRRISMGRTQSFIGSASLSWIATNVKFFRDLPSSKAFKQEGDLNLRIEFEDMNHRLQRDVNHSRQFEMVKYLLTNRNHKFPPMLLVLRADWEDEEHSDNWNNGKAERGSANYQPMGSKQASIGSLLLGGDSRGHLFAIDGQHRLNALKGLVQLCNHQELFRLTKTGATTKESISRSSLQLEDPDRYTDSFFMDILNESIGLEILCNVNPGETAEEARSRLRGVFRDVNMPRPLPANDGKVIGNPFFDTGQEAIVEGKYLLGFTELGKQKHFVKGDSTANLTAKDQYLTTAAAVAGITERFLKEHEKVKELNWGATKDVFVEPPTPEQIREIAPLADHIFRILDNLPSFVKVKSGEKPTKLREFEHGQCYLMLRPVAQEALAEACGQLMWRAGATMETDKIIERLKQLEAKGVLSSIDQVASVWYGLFTKTGARGKVAMNGTYKKEMAYGLKYFIGGSAALDEGEEESLLRLWAKGRMASKTGDKTLDWCGTKQIDKSDLQLPPIP